MTKLNKTFYVLVITFAALIAGAETAHAQPAFDAAARHTVVEGAAAALRRGYVFPDVGERAAAALESSLAAGKYNDITDTSAFAQRLTADLQAVAHDKHLRVSAFGQPPTGGPGAPSGPPRNDAGVGRADRLADNVGYLEIVAFPPLEAFKAPFDRAMAALKDTRALIIDARRHGGGTPTSEAYLASYLLAAGKRMEVNRFIWRNPGTETFRTEEFWSSPTPFSYSGKPVYVLTSSFTFSGGEALAYDLRALGLARLVGETTGGGAHPGGMVSGRRGLRHVPARGPRGEPDDRHELGERRRRSRHRGARRRRAQGGARATRRGGEGGRRRRPFAGASVRASRGAQPGGPPPAPAPKGLVVGSGNFYSPIVANLEQAVAFYRDGIGFDVQGEPTNAEKNPQLRAMFGLPDAKLRQQIGRAPPTPGGVEIVEISGAGGRLAERKMQDPGTVMLMVVVRDINATLARLKKLGAPIVTTGGAPVFVQGLLAVVVKDPAGHFVELLQLGMAPPAVEGSNANIIGVRVRHTVESLERSLALYRDGLGLQGSSQVPPYFGEPTVLDLLGLPHDVQYRFTMLTVPTSGLGIELIEFQNARPRCCAGPPRGPGLDAAAAARRGHRRGGRRAHEGRRDVHLDGGQAARSACWQYDAQGRYRARSRRPVSCADSGAAGAIVRGIP